MFADIIVFVDVRQDAEQGEPYPCTGVKFNFASRLPLATFEEIERGAGRYESSGTFLKHEILVGVAFMAWRQIRTRPSIRKDRKDHSQLLGAKPFRGLAPGTWKREG